MIEKGVGNPERRIFRENIVFCKINQRTYWKFY